MNRAISKDTSTVPGHLLAPFRIVYAGAERIAGLLADDRLMAVIGFNQVSAIDREDPRRLSVGLPELGAKETVEVWFSREPVAIGREGDIAFSRNRQVLFGHLLVDEAQGLEEVTYNAYRALVRFISHQGYPHLLRIWNYIPAINAEEGGLERYKAFNAGRHRVFAGIPGYEAALPAACAIGTYAPGLLIYFLASREPGIQIENPRQLSAFHYPPRYGAKSPCFSRATLKSWKAEDHLYISGTSSIVGHESLHRYDPVGQLQETLRNLDGLIANANRYRPLGIASTADLSLLKVYIRDALHFEPLRKHLIDALGPTADTVFLRGDICRANLQIEIEGAYLGCP